MDLPSMVRTISARLDPELDGTAGTGIAQGRGRVREALVLEQVLRRAVPETV